MSISVSEVVQAVQELVSAGVMPEDSQDVIRPRSRLLLTDTADQILQAEYQKRLVEGPDRSICVFETWQALLKRCREQGLETAFARREEMRRVETALAAFNLSAGGALRIIGSTDPLSADPAVWAKYAKLLAALIRPALPAMDQEIQAVSIAFLQAELAYALAFISPASGENYLDETVRSASECIPLLAELRLWRRLARAQLALGIASLERHKLNGVEADLAAGIQGCQQAGLILIVHYAGLQDESSLDLAVYAMQKAEAAAARPLYDWPKRRYWLGFAHYHRYSAARTPASLSGGDAPPVESNPADLDRAIEMIREAAAAAPAGEDQDMYLSDLALMLGMRYEFSGSMDDLTEAIEMRRAMLARTPRSSDDWPDRRGKLGIVLHSRFQREWRLEDLDESIRALQDALDASPPGSPEALTWRNNLSVAYRTRFEALGELADLDGAIQALRDVLADTPPGGRERPLRQYNLGLALMSRFDLTKIPQDIQDAVQAFEACVSAVTRYDERWTDYMADLGVAYRRRFELTNDVADLDSSIDCLRQALQVEPETSASRPRWIANIARAVLLRYRASGELDDLQVAAGLLAQSVASMQVRSRDWATTLSDLGTVLRDSYLHSQDVSDLAKAASAYQTALQAYETEEWPEHVCQAARALGEIFFSQAAWKEAVEAFARADQAFELLYQRQLFAAGRESWIAQLSRFYPLYVYSLAKLGDLPAAVLLMERSRARSLNDALERDHAGLEGVRQADPQAYEQFRQAVEALRQLATMERLGQRTALLGESQLPIADQAARARRDLDRAVRRIQAVPGFEAFLAPADLADLAAAVQPACPLAYLLVTSAGGLSLLVQADAGSVNLEAVWMDGFAESHLVRFLFHLQDDRVTGGYLPGQLDQPGWLKRSLAEDLPALGESLLQPLAARLESLGAESLSLVPGGLLALVPLHAAAYPGADGAACLLEQFTVRYAPSARVIAAGRRALEPGQRSATGSPILAGVGNPLPAAHPLAFARAELEAVAGLFSDGASRALYEAGATLQALQAACPGANYLHFSCHGRFDPDEALDSGLLLSNEERLTLRGLLDGVLDLSAVRLAVLSACQTGINDFTRLPDEAVGLPAGFLQAGVPGVVSSLWSVDDVSTALLVSRFYDIHLHGGLEPALALRQAQAWLRQSTVSELGLQDWFRNLYELSGRRDAQAYKSMRYFSSHPHDRPYEHPYFWAGFVFSGV